MFREQEGEKVRLCSWCTVRFNEAHRLFSYVPPAEEFIFFFSLREFIQIWYHLLQIYHAFPGLSAAFISLKVSCSVRPK